MLAIKKVDGVWRCISCGDASADQESPHLGKCSCEHRGLGDIVKTGLSAVGITEERVSKIIGRPCGCGARVEALNRIGEKLGIGGKNT